MADYLRWEAHNFLHSDAYFHAGGYRPAETPAAADDALGPERLSERDADADSPPFDSLRRQVLGIIASVLEDSDPACAGARNRLRQCLMHHVGFPEQALLEHLVSMHASELQLWHGEPPEPPD